MVSFFGLRIGGERKKKPNKSVEVSSPRQCKQFDQDPLGDEEFLTKYGPGISSDARPTSSRSHKLTKRSKHPPYLLENASAVRVDLPSPHQFRDSNYSIVRQHSSNPDLGSRWKNGSTPNLALPKAVENTTRPTTSGGNNKPQVDHIDVQLNKETSLGPKPTPKPQVDPIDVQVTKETSSPIPTSKPPPTWPRSPLGQYELKLNLPSEGATLFGDYEDGLKPPEPLRIVKQPRKPYSPPQSIKTDETDKSPAQEKPNFSEVVDSRPSSKGSHREAVTAPKRVQELSGEPSYGPRAIPSPPLSSHRPSEENHAGTPMDESGEPVIQDVRAKRDTFTIRAARRRSLEMRVEKAERERMPCPPEPPKRSSARAARPPPLDLNLRPAVTDQNVPRSAPFLVNQQSQSLLSQFPHRPTQEEQRAPTASAASDNMDIYQLDAEDDEYFDELRSGDSSDYDSAQSPVSPLIPRTGPLASPQVAPDGPCLPPRRSRTDPEAETDRLKNFRFPELSPFKESFTFFDDGDEADQDSDPVAPPPLTLRRVATTPDLTNWPLPSPTVAVPLEPPPLEPPPRMPAVLAESPSRARSFSRPWTPTNEPFKFEIMSPSSLGKGSNRSQPTSPRSPRSPRGPPPRPGANTMADRGLRSPAIVGDDFGGGFI